MYKMVVYTRPKHLRTDIDINTHSSGVKECGGADDADVNADNNGQETGTKTGPGMDYSIRPDVAQPTRPTREKKKPQRFVPG